EARRRLDIQVHHFVSNIVVQPTRDSLRRWDVPICPMVAGLPQERGEFILERISQVARDARAPLASEKCHANLYVIVTAQPDRLLTKGGAETPNMHDPSHGMTPGKEFLRSKQPIRGWYNAELVAADGSPVSSDALVVGLAGSGAAENLRVPTITTPTATRL